MPPSQFNYPQYPAAGPVRGAYPAQFGASSFNQPLSQQPLAQQPQRADGLNPRASYQQQPQPFEEKDFKAGGPRFAPPPGQFGGYPSNGRGYQQWSTGSHQN